jgi:NAD(P)-dependent dehydrogenase (short-subunit alcohol dehydrogenase family)
MNDEKTLDLAGRVAIITGAGAGLGRAYARELSRHGASVVVNDLAGDRADAVVEEIVQAGGRAVATDASVADRPGGAAIVQAAVDAFGTVDIVVANAGAMRNAYFEEQTPEDLEAMLSVHIGGAFWVTQAAWPILRAKGYGRVILTSSAAGIWGMHTVTNYAAAKGGVYALGRALAFEGQEHGIQVNMLLPGASTGISVDNPVPDYARHFPEELGPALKPRRTTESVAPFVAYLASAACPVNGETFSAVAGRYARVLIGVTDGWFADDLGAVTVEAIAEHFDEICEASTFHLPRSVFDEYRAMGPQLLALEAHAELGGNR